MKTGDNHYKAYIGPVENYDLVGAMQFNLLTSLGLRDHHKVLDIGCGSLRAGKLFMSYLQPSNYFGIEPNKWLIEDGIKNEIGQGIIDIKKPTFNHSEKFDLCVFNEKFDFIIAQSIFSHTSQQQIKDCLQHADKCLTEEGIFMGTFILGDNDYVGDDWVYPGCVRFKDETIHRLVESQGLRAIQTDWIHPNGQTWYAIFHPESQEAIEGKINTMHLHNQIPKTFRDKLKRYPIFYNTFTRKLYQLIQS